MPGTGNGEHIFTISLVDSQLPFLSFEPSRNRLVPEQSIRRINQSPKKERFARRYVDET